MGWCSATRIFDSVCDGILNEGECDKRDVIKELAAALENSDWDCQQDSDFWDHPIVKDVMKELHPSWFEDDEDEV